MIVVPIYAFGAQRVDKLALLEESLRGQSGFGSTGE